MKIHNYSRSNIEDDGRLRPGARLTKKNLTINFKFRISVFKVYLKFILSYKVKIFIEFYT